MLLALYIDAPVSDYSSRSWGGVYVIMECSRRKLLARADDVRYICISYVTAVRYVAAINPEGE